MTNRKGQHFATEIILVCNPGWDFLKWNITRNKLNKDLRILPRL